MLLQSMKVLCKAAGGAGSIWKYLEAMVRATGVSGRFACGFRTNLHYTDVGNQGTTRLRPDSMPANLPLGRKLR